jgi:outer membrane biosynthesis protein TonB
VKRREISPALMGSVALHVAVAAALLISWPFERNLKLGSAVPVTIVANAPADDLRAAVQAPEAQTAQAEQPTPQAPPEPTPPAPQPAPEPPAPQPEPRPAPQPKPAPQPTPAPQKAPKPLEKAPTPKPEPAKPAEKPHPAPKAEAKPKPERTLDLDALASSLSKMTRSSGGKASSAAKGPARAETAPQARPAMGAAEAAAALNGLTEELQRRWNPNCDVAEARDVLVHVTFVLNAGGGVMGDVRAQIRGPANPASRAAADRAVSAVYAAAPFRTLPREFYGQPIGVNFDAKKACS